jgi:hypothetical protein
MWREEKNFELNQPDLAAVVEIEKAVDTSVDMHLAPMAMARPGMRNPKPPPERTPCSFPAAWAT